MNTVTVSAQKWEQGWDLIIEGDESRATSVQYLHDVERQVRDYLGTEESGLNHDDLSIIITPDIGSALNDAETSREATKAAAQAQQYATDKARKVASELQSQGLNVTDSAYLLDISPSRVAQLLTHNAS